MRIDVTGSNIKRIDGEGPAPVEIITREQISKTGATSINELLRFIPAIDVFDQGELASNSPAGSGTGQIRLRGLSETATLVLLNGRRLPVNALYDSGAGAAVDINMIPVSLVERIEILKDGGSAIYGADALAGVINIITRKNYSGIETAARYGISSEGDGEEWGVTLAGGFGDLDKDGYNLMASFDYFKRDPIYRKDRDISKSVDFRRFGAGDYRSSFSPYGNLLDDDFAFTGEQVRPCPPENLTNSRCRYDFNASLLTAYNGADRWSGMLIGSAKVGKDVARRSAEDTLRRIRSRTTFHLGGTVLHRSVHAGRPADDRPQVDALRRQRVSRRDDQVVRLGHRGGLRREQGHQQRQELLQRGPLVPGTRGWTDRRDGGHQRPGAGGEFEGHAEARRQVVGGLLRLPCARMPGTCLPARSAGRWEALSGARSSKTRPTN
ncbi:MAG: TonB-dependent receptor plug domain-containing protein [Betaproteobacteria bacterium]|nr:TonB-dependent receptor plug domain-containing protein [Betaproteobacteria bacterium]